METIVIRISKENAEWLRNVIKSGSYDTTITTLKNDYLKKLDLILEIDKLKKENEILKSENLKNKDAENIKNINETLTRFEDELVIINRNIVGHNSYMKGLLNPKEIITPVIQDNPQADKTIDDIEVPKSVINEISKVYEGMTNADQLIADAIILAKEKMKEKV